MNHPFNRLKGSFKSAKQSTDRLLQRSVLEAERTWDRLRDRRICLGVTGFSQSGKSTFLTSFIHQLMHFPSATLPAFSPILRDRVLGVELHPLGDQEVETFDYLSGAQSLSLTPPEWPQPTKGLSAMLMEIRYKPNKGLFQLPGKPYNRLFVEIRDYPGEWLLDLPLLELGYREWCYESAALYASGLRTQLVGYYQQLEEQVDPFAPADEVKISEIGAQFSAFLQRCRNAGLNLIQPGRFLLPGTDTASMAPFFPLISLMSVDPEKLNSAPDGCYYRVLESRYKTYVDTYVKTFYQNSFSGIDRQIVLVDLLGALNGGQACFDDMRASLSQVLDSFQYGQNSLLSKLFKPRIDKVVFAASKVDQVLPEQHENTRSLMAATVYSAYRMARYKQVDSYCEAIASVRSSSIQTHNNDNHLVGVGLNGAAGLMRHPNIPDHIPTSEDWAAFNDWQLRRLAPPAGLRLVQGEGLPHIRLDTVMRELLGDKFS